MVRIDFLLCGAALLATALMVTTAMADPIERYAELQAVGEAINDPDPLMRLALLEEIIEKGDATEVQLAIRTAFSIDDPNIRSLALRTHFASFRTVTLTAEYPAALQAIVDSGDIDKIEEARDRHKKQFAMMDQVGGVFKFRTEYSEPTSTEFVVHSLNAISKPDDIWMGQGNIKGAVVVLQSGVKLPSNSTSGAFSCTFELLNYEGFTVKGTGSCDYGDVLPFPVTMHLFEPNES